MSMIILKDNLPDIDIDTSSFVYEGNFILIQDEYICDVLTCMNVLEINEIDFHYICGKYFMDYPQVLESYALKSPNNAYHYALYVLKGRFELGEPAIATNSFYSFYYALDVLKGRFELGEHTILESIYEDEYREEFLLVSTTGRLLRFIKHIWNKLCQ